MLDGKTKKQKNKMTIIFVFLFIYGVFSMFSDLSFEDIWNDILVQTANIKYNVIAQIYICHIILFIMVLFVVYFGDIDDIPQGSQDFENFKNLLKKEGVE